MKATKSVTIFGAVIMIILPILNNLVLSYIYALIDGDVMYASAASILEICMYILSVVVYFGSVGILLNTSLRKNIKGTPRKTIIIFFILSMIIIYGSGYLVSALTSSIFAEEVISYLIMSVLTILNDIIVFVAVLILCAYLNDIHKIKSPAQLSTNGKIIAKGNIMIKAIKITSLTVFITIFLQSVIETVLTFVDYGTPITFADYMYLAEPYISLIIFTVVGYFSMLVISIIFDNFYKKPKIKE